MDPDKESLRYTLFYSIFGNSLLVKTKADAESLRSHLIAHKCHHPLQVSGYPRTDFRVSLPDIYTEDGLRYDSIGVRFPAPANLSYVFGDQNQLGSEEYKKVISGA